MGEVLHQAEEVDIHGTSVFASEEGKSQGTFTTYFGLRYALIGFSGVGNEHSAKLSRLTGDDYATFLKAVWNGVRSAANTRTKRGQVPHLLIDLEYKPGEEFQFGRLQDYVRLEGANGKAEKVWSSPGDYKINLEILLDRLDGQVKRIEQVSYVKSADIRLTQDLPGTWKDLKFDT
jgi:CRISPR-associated protein Csh2